MWYKLNKLIIELNMKYYTNCLNVKMITEVALLPSEYFSRKNGHQESHDSNNIKMIKL